MKVEQLEKIIEKQDEYIELLGEELDDVVQFASLHGWKSSRYEEGKKLRGELASLKEQDINMKAEQKRLITDLMEKDEKSGMYDEIVGGVEQPNFRKFSLLEESETITSDSTVIEQPKGKEGWECPRCHTIHSYLKMSCDCPPMTINSTTCGMTNPVEQPKEVEGRKSAEEILEKYCGKINVPFDNYACEYHTSIIKAMHEYAAQFPAIDLRKELNSFIKEIKTEFADENWDYLGFIADRFVQSRLDSNNV